MGLAVTNVTVAFGKQCALDSVSFVLEPAGVHSIIGPNGSGKSTLFNVITGAVPAARGTVHLDEASITRWKPATRARAGIRRSFQGAQVLDRSTVRSNLEIAAGPPPVIAHRVDRWLELFSLQDKSSILAAALSFGQRRLLSVAMASIAPYRVLLLDEPVAGLSPRMVAQVAQVIRSLPGAIIVIEHNFDFLRMLGGQAHLLAAGRITRSGPLEDVLSSEEMKRAYS